MPSTTVPDRHRCPPHLRYRHCRQPWALLSAIKYAKVKVHPQRAGPCHRLRDRATSRSNDDRADDIAVELLRSFLEKIKRRHTYRNSRLHLDPDHHLNVVYEMPCRTVAPALAIRPRPELRCQAALPLGTGRHLNTQPSTPMPSWTPTLTRAHHLNVNVFASPTCWHHGRLPGAHQVDSFGHQVRLDHVHPDPCLPATRIRFIDLTKYSSSTLSRTCQQFYVAVAAAAQPFSYTVLYHPVTPPCLPATSGATRSF